MLKEYKTVYSGGAGELIEKKSRFIATVKPVLKEEEASAFIESMKKKYWNAAHNCFAYVIGENNEVQRCSDDGEPSGTAGKPILDVLLLEEIHNTVVVVTRYFGGTLLGKGGLVRAYGNAAKIGLTESVLIHKIYGRIIRVTTDYTGLYKIQYLVGQRGLTILDTEYTEKVFIQVLIPEENVREVITLITEGTNGQAKIKEGDSCYFSNIDGVMTIFDQ